MKKANVYGWELDALIRIIELPEEYRGGFSEAAKSELARQNFSKHKQRKAAVELYRSRLQKILRSGAYRVDGYQLPNSAFLSELERKKIFQKELTKLKELRQDFHKNYPLG